MIWPWRQKNRLNDPDIWFVLSQQPFEGLVPSDTPMDLHVTLGHVPCTPAAGNTALSVSHIPIKKRKKKKEIITL